MAIHCFNPRARVGATRWTSFWLRSRSCCFNPRARVGATPEGLALLRELDGCLNPRARVGATPGDSRAALPACCFNPRARVGATPVWVDGVVTTNPVSIHAPVWARHLDSRLNRLPHSVSIHAPVWARHAGATRLDTCGHVSIHAPVWARHPRRTPRSRLLSSFNPRARVGATPATFASSFSMPFSFNPRARVGATRRESENRAVLALVSIHAPVWARHLN